MKTPEGYEESIKRLNRKVYFMGNKVEHPTEHPILKPSLNAVKLTYQLAQQDDFAGVMRAQSHISAVEINRFTHIVHSTDDLIIKLKMLRLMGQKTGTCFQRCAGLDAINAVYSTTFEIDQQHKTEYHCRFKQFLQYVQEQDLVCAAAMTDPKGNRANKPSAQEDPDLYLHIVEKKASGIVIKGAKAHLTGALNSHEILVMPTAALGPNDRDYAVICAVPVEAPGVVFICGRQPSDTRLMYRDGLAAIDSGNRKFGGNEALVIFDNVFVPNERVFMCGEWDFCSSLVERFACYHRQSYGGCKVGVGDTLIGSTAILAECIGVHEAGHIRDKIAEMIFLNETMFACGMGSSAMGKPLPSGAYWVDPLLANVTKLNVTENPFRIARLAQDIAGGILATLPSAEDLEMQEVAGYLNKYLQGTSQYSVNDRFRMLRYVESLCIGRGAAAYLTESLHGAGSPQAQKVMIGRFGQIEAKKALAKDLAGIGE